MPTQNEVPAMIRDAIAKASDTEVGLQPAVLMSQFVDHSRAVEYTSVYVNDSWALKIKELLESGFIIFRIQTEFDHDQHVTMAYMAKLKAN